MLLTGMKQEKRALEFILPNKYGMCFSESLPNPQLYAPVFGDIRLAIVPQFPYGVYYRTETTLIRILAVFHNRRDPAIWQGRV